MLVYCGAVLPNGLQFIRALSKIRDKPQILMLM